MVAKATSNVPQYSGTYITRNFLQHRTRSWQAHLERISTYLTPGEGVCVVGENSHWVPLL